jgi:multicomponent Na+:H+ antiporter subunit B
MADRVEVVEREPRHRAAVGWTLTLAVGALLAVAVIALPRGANPLPAIARYAMTVALPQWRSTEPVSEVVYGTRGFDTFGETFLLLAAVVAISVLCRPREQRRGFIGESLAGQREQHQVGHPEPAGAPQRIAERAEERESGARAPSTPDAERVGTAGPETSDAMSVVVRAGVRFLAPVLTMAGLYLVAWGYSPGGGFPAGAAMLGVALLAYVSRGYRWVEPVLRPGVVEPVELAGALLIVVIGVSGLLLDGSFLANFLPLGPPQTIRSGGTLQAFSVTEFIEVATGLVLAVFGLLGMGHDWSREDDR